MKTARELEHWLSTRKVVIAVVRASGQIRWTAEVRALRPKSQLLPDLYEGYGATIEAAISQACDRYDADNPEASR